MHPLAGVYSATVTPLKADFSPDLEAIPSLLGFFAGRGCHGVLLLGSTGEGPSFSPEERIGIMRAATQVRDTYPPVQGETIKLLAGTGTPSLTETSFLTHSAFDMGYEGVVVLPPYYYRKATDEGLFRYFSELIHKAVPKDGFLLGYHFPGAAGIGFSTDLLERLKDAFPHQFAGIKDSSHDADFARQLGERFGSDLLVLTGTDSYLQLALEHQAGGCITAPANLISADLRQVWDTFQGGGDVKTLQERVTQIRQHAGEICPLPAHPEGTAGKTARLPALARPPAVGGYPAGNCGEGDRRIPGGVRMNDAWRLLTTPPARGAWNMAADEAILEAVGRGDSLPTLRLYAWDPACLSLGYAQPLSDVDIPRLQSHGWEMVRRPTGGRAILHTDEITYSVIAPLDEPRVAGTVLESYSRLAAALVEALHLLDLPVEVQERPGEQQGSQPGVFRSPIHL